MKKQIFEKIQEEILSNWRSKNNFLGIKRRSLESLSEEKNWKKRKVIAKMRREKLIILNKRNYFVDMDKLIFYLKKEGQQTKAFQE